MSSLYATVQAAEELLQNGDNEAAAGACAFARNIIRQHWPKDGENPPAICCFSIEGDVVWCHDRERKPLYPAPIAERPELCKVCREDCRRRIELLTQALAEKTGGP